MGQGTILVIVLWFLVINVLVDLVYAAIDPRISLRLADVDAMADFLTQLADERQA